MILESSAVYRAVCKVTVKSPSDLALLLRWCYCWQNHRKGTPTSQLAIERDASTVATNRIGNDRQAKSSAATVTSTRLITTVETLKDLLTLVVRNTTPRIDNSDADRRASPCNSDSYRPPWRGMLQPILRQVDEDASEERSVPRDHRFERPGSVEEVHTTGGGEGLQLIDHLFEENPERQFFSPYRRILAREEQEIAD